MSASRTPPRALSAAAVLVVLVAALLGAWFYAGWRDVRARQQEIRIAPRRAADERANALARELHGQLEALIVREVRRPYFHYQNLMHDPDAPGLSVSPSPLARGSEDALVLGYFQLDAKGKVSTPTINDDVPSLSEPKQRAAHQAFRAQVKQDLSAPLAAMLPTPARATRTRRASPPATPAPTAPVTASASQPVTPPPPAAPAASATQQTQVIQLDPRVYTQNANPALVYSQQASARLAALPSTGPALTTPTPAQTPPPQPVTITISPLEWRTLPFDGEPSLLAVRQVQTPDATFAQGLVINPAALGEWVESRTSDLVAELRPADDDGVEVVPGWRLTVAPLQQRLTQADLEAEAIARTFLTRFFSIGALAVGAAAFVVVLVRRAESLARERSRFAAAAAHELRTPLAGLQLYGDLLAEGLGDPDKARDYARRMSEEAARLGRVVANVLAFSQLERDHLRIDAQPGRLTEALRELADGMRPALERSGATLDVDVAPELRARFDRDALARIIGNLIDNAEKYARDATDRTIRLSARAHGAFVDVAVEDRGHGVANATTLFKPFARGTSGNDSPPGLGLGLTLSRAQARAMKGDLSYEPREGGGARFVLRLPSA
jgi:signal transduction histidine kinase